MSTKERAAQIRADYKRHGWSAQDISVRIDTYSMGSSIDVRIKHPNVVSFTVAKALAERHESVRRCEYSGEILSGGNRYVSVSYSHEAAKAIEAQYADVLAAADRALTADPSDNSLHPIGQTGYLLGKSANGYGRSLWKDGHITEAYNALGLALSLHTGIQA